VCQLVEEDSVEFVLTQHTVNSLGKRDMRMQNPVHCGTLPPSSELYPYAISKETRPLFTDMLMAHRLRIATLSPYPQTQPRKHQSSANQPHHEKRHSEG